MSRGRVAIVLAALLLAPSALAQIPPAVTDAEEASSGYVNFDVDFGTSFIVEIPNPAQPGVKIPVTVDDKSVDLTGSGSAPSPANNILYTVDVQPVDNASTWPGVQSNFRGFTIVPGGSFSVLELNIGAPRSGGNPYYEFVLNITAKSQNCCEPVSQTFNFVVYNPGLQLLVGLPENGGVQRSAPDRVKEYGIRYTNPSTELRTFDMEESSNNCGLNTVMSSFQLGPGESKVVPVLVEAPNDKFFYAAEACTVQVRAAATDGTNIGKTNTLIMNVRGVYVEPGAVWSSFVWLAVLGGVIFLILLAKRRAEEEVLGKPQPPWTLPAEQVYLTELEKKDPRAAYVVRHFLMEDEYQTSLLWYKSFKRATRGRRAVERKVLKLEHAFEKWDMKQQDQLDGFDDDSERKINKLQAKLDKKGAKSHKKVHKKWRKAVGKLETAAANAHNKAMGEWRKAAKKAQKKGEPVPKEPVMAAPDLPPEPEQEAVMLDDHKWAAKKERYLDKASEAEAKAFDAYEQKRAKRLAAIEKKFAKWAQKIDDPEFVNEHPMLKEAAASAS